MTLSVTEITERWLRNRGYQGLCVEGEEGCGCDIDDLFPCSSSPRNCVAGYRFECERCARENCDRRNDDFGVIFSPRKDFCEPIYGGAR